MSALLRNRPIKTKPFGIIFESFVFAQLEISVSFVEDVDENIAFSHAKLAGENVGFQVGTGNRPTLLASGLHDEDRQTRGYRFGDA